jgi:hypothetical protein
LRDLKDVDVAISRTGEESVAVGRPGKGDNPRKTTLDRARGLDLLENILVSGGAEPVVLGREGQGADGRAGFERVEVLALVDIPEHSGAVLATGSAEGSVGGDGDVVDDTGVTREVSAELEVVKIPDLDEPVPTSRDDKRLLGGRREPDAGDPVLMLVIDKGVLALTEGVPELDTSVTTGRDDLSVVSGEGNREDIRSVTDEGTDGGTGGDVPESESLVPRSRQGEETVRRDAYVLDSLVMTSKGTLGEAT